MGSLGVMLRVSRKLTARRTEYLAVGSIPSDVGARFGAQIPGDCWYSLVPIGTRRSSAVPAVTGEAARTLLFFLRPHRLVAKDACLSGRRRRFEFSWGHHVRRSCGRAVFAAVVAP